MKENDLCVRLLEVKQELDVVEGWVLLVGAGGAAVALEAEVQTAVPS